MKRKKGFSHLWVSFILKYQVLSPLFEGLGRLNNRILDYIRSKHLSDGNVQKPSFRLQSYYVKM